MAPTPSTPDEFSSRALFQRAGEPIFILNRHRRIRYVNPAFEQLTRKKLDEIYGRLASGRHRDSTFTALSKALAAPAEVLKGQPATVRRPAPPARFGPPWWDIAFLPIAGPEGLLAIVGRIRVVGKSEPRPSRSLPEPLLALRHQLPARFDWSRLATDVPASSHVVEQARLAAQHRAPLIIQGEPGAGKRTIARVIHHHGLTADRTLLDINAAALPPWSIEHQLELAASETIGTICLREPSMLPRDQQARIVEAIGESKIGGRWIATCTSDPAQDVVAGRLLAELHLALSVQAIELVPLRDRLDDLPRLVQSMLESAESSSTEVSADAMAVLRSYSWPGNLSELRAVLLAATNSARGQCIDVVHLPETLRLAAARDSQPAPPKQPAPIWKLDQVLEAVERRLILLALKKAKGNKTDAAAMLEIWRPRLLRRIEALKLESTESGKDIPGTDDDAPPANRGV